MKTPVFWDINLFTFTFQAIKAINGKEKEIVREKIKKITKLKLSKNTLK